MRVVYIERSEGEFAVRITGSRGLDGPDVVLIRTFPNLICAERYAYHAARPDGVIVNNLAGRYGAAAMLLCAACGNRRTNRAAARSRMGRR